MAKSIKKVIKKSVGTNVRLTDLGFKTIKTFCESRGYKIGAFVEIAALKKIATETIEEI